MRPGPKPRHNLLMEFRLVGVLEGLACTRTAWITSASVSRGHVASACSCGQIARRVLPECAIRPRLHLIHRLAFNSCLRVSGRDAIHMGSKPQMTLTSGAVATSGRPVVHRAERR